MPKYADNTTEAMVGDVVRCAKPGCFCEGREEYHIENVNQSSVCLRNESSFYDAALFSLVRRADQPQEPKEPSPMPENTPLVKWPEEEKAKAMAKRISDRIHNVGCWAADFVLKVVTEEMARTETPEDEYGNIEPEELFVFVDHPQVVLRKLPGNAIVLFGDVRDSYGPAAYALDRKVRRVTLVRKPVFEVI